MVKVVFFTCFGRRGNQGFPTDQPSNWFWLKQGALIPILLELVGKTDQPTNETSVLTNYETCNGQKQFSVR